MCYPKVARSSAKCTLKPKAGLQELESVADAINLVTRHHPA